MKLWNVIEDMTGYKILTIKNKKGEVLFDGCILDSNGFYKKEVTVSFNTKIKACRIIARGYYEVII